MNKLILPVIASASSIVWTVVVTPQVLGISYADFSSSVSGRIGQSSSTTANIITVIWLIIIVLALYTAYRVADAKQRKAVEKAHQRMMERKKRNAKPAPASKTNRTGSRVPPRKR